MPVDRGSRFPHQCSNAVMPTILLTGFPGFLGSQLLPRLLASRPQAEAICLVQPKFSTLARQRAAELIASEPALAGRIRLVEGDITLPSLGLALPAIPVASVTEIFHLAAVYDLAVQRETALRINVAGTRHLLSFAQACPALHRFHHVSTCYVSGRLPGVFAENDLICGQTFNNFYEETKYLAEVEVHQAMAAGLPATIYRPSVVVGDSRSGATQKLDGPLYVVQWLLRQGRVAVLPMVGRPAETLFNMVPSDCVVEAISFLSTLPGAAGRVYHLADPDPPTIDEIVQLITAATGQRVLRVPLPLWLAKGTINRVPGVFAVLQIPAQALDYFVHPTRYATTQTQQDLAPSGIQIPRLRDYVGPMVEFVRTHRQLGARAMV